MNALDKWLAKHDDDKHPDADAAKKVGAATTGALAAGFVAKHELKDRADKTRVRGTRSFDDFVNKLEPGDILFHHRDSKTSPTPEIGKMTFPGTEADWLMGVKGDPYYHSSVYMGKGRIGEAADIQTGIKKNSPIRYDFPENLMAYRPNSGQEKAIKYIKNRHGKDYMGVADMWKHGISHLIDPTGGPKTTHSLRKCKTQACTQLTANAYKDIFGKMYDSPAEMRHAKDIDLIARYEPMGGRNLRELALTRGIYPVVKNVSKGLLAGALTYGGLKAYRHYKEKEKKDGEG